MDNAIVLGVVILCALLFFKVKKMIFKVIAIAALAAIVVYVIPTFIL